jgi:hypothetical protein
LAWASITRVRVEELVLHYPRLFHVAAAGAWPSIARHGLLPAAQLLDGAPAARRTRAVTVQHPTFGRVVLRDQTPLRPDLLAAALTDLTPAQWLALLADRVFFWLHPARLANLLAARHQRGAEHDVLTVDTAALVAAHADRVRLAPINSGSTLFPGAPPRGSGTFLPIADYPFAQRRRGRPLAAAVVELAVVGGVPDLVRYVVAAERRRGPDRLHALPLHP